MVRAFRTSLLESDEFAWRVYLRRELRRFNFIREQFLMLATKQGDPRERRVDLSYAAEAEAAMVEISDELARRRGLAD